MPGGVLAWLRTVLMLGLRGLAQVSSRGRSAGRSSAARAGRSGDPRGRPRTGSRDDATRRGEGSAQGDPARRPVPRQDQAARRERVRAVVEPVVTAAGYDLEDLSLARAGRRQLVRVVLDRDGGVSLDDVADVSRAVSVALDAAEESTGELFAGEYALEVGSPGVDRPLTLPRHWRRNTGRLVKVHVAGAPEGAGSTLTGRVVSADDDGVVLDVDGEPRQLAYGNMGPGRVQIEFTRLGDVDDADLAEMGADEDDEDLEGER